MNKCEFLSTKAIHILYKSTRMALREGIVAVTTEQ